MLYASYRLKLNNFLYGIYVINSIVKYYNDLFVEVSLVKQNSNATYS